LPAATVYSGLTSTLDLYPTIAEAAGIPFKGLDGVNLLPFVTGELNDPPHDTLFWMTHNKGAVRAGNWKLVIDADSTWMLFNLHEDLAEQHDLAGSEPGTAGKLIEAWENWNRSFPVSFTDSTRFALRKKKSGS
jgi:arylsulfatase A-like enzyme